MQPSATIRRAISRVWPPPTSKAARVKIAAWTVAGIVLIGVVVYYLTQSGGLSDSTSCTTWLKASPSTQAAYVNGWAKLPDYKEYGPEFTSLCRAAVSTEATAGTTDLGTIGEDIINGHG